MAPSKTVISQRTGKPLKDKNHISKPPFDTLKKRIDICWLRGRRDLGIVFSLVLLRMWEGTQTSGGRHLLQPSPEAHTSVTSQRVNPTATAHRHTTNTASATTFFPPVIAWFLFHSAYRSSPAFRVKESKMSFWGGEVTCCHISFLYYVVRFLKNGIRFISFFNSNF